MKKMIALFLSLALLLTCTAVLAEEKAAEPRVAHYQIRNLTGDGIFFLTLTDNQTGEVLELLGEGEVIPVDGIFFLNLNADESETDEALEHRYTLSFSNGGENVYEFKTLSFENVLIDLLAADAMTGATPNGRLAGMPISDTMSASQQADTNGPTAAARSYGKLDFGAYSNGTLLNMWISQSEMIEQ